MKKGVQFSVRMLGCMLALTAMLPLVHAQEYRARVQGTVIDPSQASITGATVSLINNNTGVRVTRSSDMTGRVLFDLVDPGTYTLDVEMGGFRKARHENVLVQARGDVTLDTAMQLGQTSDSVTVAETVSGVEFNSAKVETVLDSKLVDNLPNFGRNPFLLALIDPSIESERPQNNLPYNSWGSNSLKIAGSARFSNDLQIDGAPITLGLKSSYVPNSSSVHEVSIQKNAVDAEFGNSSGGIVSIALNSGTNAFHGTAWFTGRYPWAAAIEDRHYRTVNVNRQNMWGADLGNPILKNKLFNYFSYEQWKVTAPGNYVTSLASDLERQGDFSQSRNVDGGPLAIYDPWTTVTDASGKATRELFAGGKIPVSRQDPLAMKYMAALWKPNRPGDDPTGLNNYAMAAPNKTEYKNFSDRVDYNMNEKIRFNGRYSRFIAPQNPTNPTGSPVSYSNGGNDEGTNVSTNLTYMLSPTTVIDVHGDWHSFVDEVGIVPGSTTPFGSFDSLFPNQDWVKLVQYPGTPLAKMPPRVNIDGRTWLGRPDGYWFSHPEGNSIHAKILHNYRDHFIKAGVETRYQFGRSITVAPGGFSFYSSTTASTYINPDTRKSGNGWASFVTGALNDDWTCSWCGTSYMQQATLNEPISRFWSAFVNDDWKVTKDLTVTFGMRWEYEEPWQDSKLRASRGLDLSLTNPTLAANPPQIDPATTALVQQFSNVNYHLLNGVWQFTDNSHPGMWNALSDVFLPRIGLAYRLNDKTALSAAWARWAHPWVQQDYGNTGSLLDVNYPAFNTVQGPAPMVQGIPQVTFSNPFPASHPLVPALGKAYGANWGLGDGGTNLQYNYQNRKKGTSDRLNVGIQRELPYNTVLKFTYLANLSHNIGQTLYPNRMDPMLNYVYKGALNQQVTNPFYHYGTPLTFPGPMRDQQTIPLTQLLRPYPQYQDINVDWGSYGKGQYHSLDVQLNRPFKNGLTLLLAYGYHYQKDQIFYDDVAQYNQQYTWQDSSNARHRISAASTWEIPVGRKRMFLANVPRALDYAIGGWNLAGVGGWSSGANIGFGGYLVTGDPRENVPQGFWFNPSVFQRMPDYTRRTNPNLYPGLNGPGSFNIDATLSKEFAVIERVKVRMQMTAYNALNGFTPAFPSSDINAGDNFGRSVGQAGNTFGRRMDFGLKVLF